jgi:hypothetical protein
VITNWVEGKSGQRKVLGWTRYPERLELAVMRKPALVLLENSLVEVQERKIA